MDARRWLVLSAAWLPVAGMVMVLGLQMERQELQLERFSARHAHKLEEVQRAWERWDGSSQPDPSMWNYLPVSSRAGVLLVRYLLANPNDAVSFLWQRIEHLPLLVDAWYRDVPPEQLLDGEIALLAWVALPRSPAGSAMVSQRVDVGVALDAVLAAEVARRCPKGCAPLTGADGAALRKQLIAQLDQTDGRIGLLALDLLLRSGAAAVPELKQRLEAGGSPHGRTLAFLGLVRLVEEEERRRLLVRTLESEDVGLRMLAMLEAARNRETRLLPQIEALKALDEPPGAGLVAVLTASLLSSSPLPGELPPRLQAQARPDDTPGAASSSATH